MSLPTEQGLGLPAKKTLGCVSVDVKIRKFRQAAEHSMGLWQATPWMPILDPSPHYCLQGSDNELTEVEGSQQKTTKTREPPVKNPYL